MFTYAGDVVTSEVSTSSAATITRTFATDDAGSIIKITISGDPTTLHNGEYLVTWNGHGDALALSKIDPSTGVLTAANRYAYSSWGTPTTTTLNSYADLGFRYLYVGRSDVQWDSSSAIPAGLLYMHARHYSPEFGRFLQPDPAAAETNLYAYSENNPITYSDPSGTCAILCIVVAAALVNAVVSLAAYVMQTQATGGRLDLGQAGIALGTGAAVGAACVLTSLAGCGVANSVATTVNRTGFRGDRIDWIQAAATAA